MKKFFKFLFPVLVLAGGVYSFQYLKATAEKPEPIQRKSTPPVVSVQTVEITRASPTVRLFGSVESPSLGLVTSAVEADVKDVLVLEGESVRAGDVLVVLDDTDFTLEQLQRQAELAEIEALIESDRVRLVSDREALAIEEELLKVIQRSVERASRLSQSRTGSEAALDQELQNEQRQMLAISQRQQSINDAPARLNQLNARMRKAEAALKRTNRDIDRTVIRAPFDGRIAGVNVSQGDRVNRNGALINIYSESQLELRAQIPSSIVSTLHAAMDTDVPVRAYSEHNGKSIELALHRLSALVEQGQGGVDAFFRPAQGVLPVWGTNMEMQVSLPEIQDVVLLHPDAIYDRNRVYIVRDNVLISTQVNVLGERNTGSEDRWILVSRDGLNQGDQILTSRLPRAITGLEVDVR